MVNFPPLAPSVEWWTLFLASICQGNEIQEAVIEANSGFMNPKNFGRYFISSPKDVTEMLSLAVEGGGRQLRDFNRIHHLRLSEHGNWRKMHLGALEANLGRKPFFHHIFPAVERVYFNKKLENLHDFNTAIFETLLSFLLEEISISDLKKFKEVHILKERGAEIKNRLNPEISLIDAYTSLGKEAILGLLS